MSVPILATKLYAPPHRAKAVLRSGLIARLNEGLQRKLTLISAPAGFGKTTLVSEWLAACGRPAAWLSLDEGDSEPARFLTYFIAALQTIAPQLGAGQLPALQTPQPPPAEAVLAALLNEISALPQPFILILDDYHAVDSKTVDEVLALLLERQPPPLHLVIATREDPRLPLARLRASHQLTELRAADLRFSFTEAADFLKQTMGLALATDEIAALEARTEGWVAGLQLAAISMQGVHDTANFIESFTGSHRFVLDYLLEEVLNQQPPAIQDFLLRTAILPRFCGPLCEAVVLAPPGAGQKHLEYLEQANLFIIPLDKERRWYRYHHLFADLLRQRLTAASVDVNALHIRASQWFEENGLELEAFQHAATANDIERAERLSVGKTIPLHFRGAVLTILNWLQSLPLTVLNAKPYLWWRTAGLMLMNGQTTGVEEKLQAAENALQGKVLDEATRNLTGQIAAARATLALTHYQPDVMLAQSQRALEYLHPSKLNTRANAYWTMGIAHMFWKDLGAARTALLESIALSQAAGDIFTNILATIGLGAVQEAENQLHAAAETYRRVLQITGDQPLQIINEAHLGLARALYEWNDLEAAQQHAERSWQLAQQYDRVIDRFIIAELFLAKLKLARGEVVAAAEMLTQTHQVTRQKKFTHRLPEVVAAQIQLLLAQGNPAEALLLARTHQLPFKEAQVQVAQGEASAAFKILAPLHQQAQAKGWVSELFSILTLEAVALYIQGERDLARQRLGEALALAEPEGFIRSFVDMGQPMAQLLAEAARHGLHPSYISKLLAAFPNTENQTAQPLIEPLSERELEVLRLIADGLSNHEIAARLFLALDTVKGHNRKIFEKLQVQRRTEAVAAARKFGLL